LLEETTYYFKIRAYDEMPLYSTFSNVVFATTPDVTPPDTPTSLIFTAIGGTYLKLSWTSSTSTDLEGFQVYVNDTGSKSSFHYLATTANCYFNYTGLPEETKYYFRLTAFDEVPLYSAFSYIASASTLDITAPTPPKNLITQNPSKHEIILRWTPNSEQDIAGYDIYMNNTGAGSSGPYHKIDTLLGNPHEYTVICLCEKTTYYFVITAFDEVPNYSEHSNMAIGSTLDKTAPSAPTGLFATAVSGTQIDLSWNANSELDLVGYHIYINDTGNDAAGTFHINHTVIGSKTSYILTNLLEETTYYFKLKAFDDVPNFSPFSEVAFATTPDVTPPSTPTGLAVSDPDDRNLTISWNPNSELDLAGYILFRSLAPDGPFTAINSRPITTIQYYDTDLEENSIYYYKVQAIDDAKLKSPLSEVASGKTLFSPYSPEINIPPGEITLQEDIDDYHSINLYQWFIDKNNKPLTFMHTSVENVEVIMFEENGTVILKPRDDWSGQEAITFFARNEFSMISDEVSITVLPVNDPPTNVIITSPEDLAKITVGEYLIFVGECFDPDINYGDKLTFSWYSSINGTLGQGKTLRDIHLGVGEHLITLEVTDSSGETSQDAITVTVLEGAVSEDPEEDNTGLIIGSIGVIIIVLIIILFLFLQFKKKKTLEADARALPPSPAKKPVGPAVPAQAKYHTQTGTHPSSPIASSTLFPASQARPQALPIFNCPSCGSAIYEPNKCLNCGWMGK
jgi:fibronectin type 3 domain-containing protein